MQKIQKIHDAAIVLAQRELDLKTAREDKDDAESALFDAMLEQEMSIYQCDDVLVQIETKSKAKAKVTEALRQS